MAQLGAYMPTMHMAGMSASCRQQGPKLGHSGSLTRSPEPDIRSCRSTKDPGSLVRRSTAGLGGLRPVCLWSTNGRAAGSNAPTDLRARLRPWLGKRVSDVHPAQRCLRYWQDEYREGANGQACLIDHLRSGAARYRDAAGICVRAYARPYPRLSGPDELASPDRRGCSVAASSIQHSHRANGIFKLKLFGGTGECVEQVWSSQQVLPYCSAPSGPRAP